jgi:phenylalanyl-tRNA synthetase alpha chain
VEPGKLLKDHPNNNISPMIVARMGRSLHRTMAHPLNIIKTKIETYFSERAKKQGGVEFAIFDDLAPVVKITQNFDDLLIPPDHVSRAATDTYYIDDETMLRGHTSAHQASLLQNGYDSFLCSGDVYRRDDIDSSHYPVFHQMEGVRVFPQLAPPEGAEKVQGNKEVEADLKDALEGMVDAVFGPVEKRWVDAYFPFTEPSFELEILYKGEWLEVLGCGVMQQDILRRAGRGEQPGWAFGLGLERLAMVLFNIPDIRLFWSEDERFTSQFKDGVIAEFQAFSKYPGTFRDVSFWLDPKTPFHPNDLSELVRELGGDLVEEVKLFDQFTHPKTGKTSNTFRINYRSMERSLTNDEINELQDNVRQKLVGAFNVELRGP